MDERTSLEFFTQARKRNPNLNFLVRIFSGGVGVFHVKGWGPKSSACPSKPGKSNCFGGISRQKLPGYPGGARKVREKKGLCSIFVPYLAQMGEITPLLDGRNHA